MSSSTSRTCRVSWSRARSPRPRIRSPRSRMLSARCRTCSPRARASRARRSVSSPHPDATGTHARATRATRIRATRPRQSGLEELDDPKEDEQQQRPDDGDENRGQAAEAVREEEHLLEQPMDRAGRDGAQPDHRPAGDRQATAAHVHLSTAARAAGHVRRPPVTTTATAAVEDASEEVPADQPLEQAHRAELRASVPASGRLPCRARSRAPRRPGSRTPRSVSRARVWAPRRRAPLRCDARRAPGRTTPSPRTRAP